MRSAVLLALLAFAACAGSPAASPDPVVEVLPPTGPKPHRLTAASIPPDEAGIREALAVAGIGLRYDGSRRKLRVRFAPLDPKAESYLLDLFGIGDDAFSKPSAFGPADAIRVRSVSTGEVPVGFTVHLVPRMEDGAFSGFSAGALVRPERGTLLPVLRGEVASGRTGSLLLVGEAGPDVVFACLLRMEIAGSDQLARLEVPTAHEVAIDPFRIRSTLLAQLLVDAGLPETVGPGGIELHRIDPDRRDRLEKDLFVNGDREKKIVLSDAGPIRLGRARLTVRPEFDPRAYRYRTEIERKGARSAADHTVQELLLLVVWDGAGRGVSYAALIRIRPGR
jgi:hypothetical protein